MNEKKRWGHISWLALALALVISLCSCSFFAPDLEKGDNDISASTHKDKKTDSNDSVATDGADVGEQSTDNQSTELPGQSGENDSTDGVGDLVNPENCEHRFEEWKTLQEAGCFGIEGIRERTCALCGTVERETRVFEGHADIVEDPAREATCTAEGMTEGKHCKVCGEVLLAQSVIPLRSHSYSDSEDPDCDVCGFLRDINCEHANTITIDGKEPSCVEPGYTEGTRCSDCGEIIIEPEMIAASGHKEKVIEGYEPTETEQGLTDGKFCTVCSSVTVPQRPIMPIGYSNIERYASTYGYDALLSLEKGEKMQQLYEEIDEIATRFHTDTTLDATPEGDTFVVSSINFSSLGLSSEDAIVVWTSYRNDHPLYYWINSSFTYSDEKLNFLTGEDYATGEAREKYNKIVFDGVREYLSKVNNESSPYRIALGLHDEIIKNVSYAYADDGVSPETALWAHNVLGVFDCENGVCESYAKTFQLLLNYCEVENIYVTGESMGEDHAWNMVKMDNGEWYWFDLTWDDTPNWADGVSYNYFCTTDGQDVSQMDGPWKADQKSFADTHAHSNPDSYNIDYLYSIPERAKKTVDADVAILRDVFVVDGFKYAVKAFNEVQLIGILKSGEVEIPESVSYDGYSYDVVAIGGMEGKLFKTVPIENAGDINAVYIPSSVENIWDKALMIYGLESIEVSGDNKAYESVDGVLFTKGLYTLVQYPIGSTVTEYAIPDEVREIANYSFGDGVKGSLQKLTVGKNVSLFGTMNAGYGYRSDSKGTLYVADGDMFYIRGLMNFSGEIIISPLNPNFVQADGALYSADMKTLHYITNTALISFECPDSVEILDVGAFFACQNMKTLTFGGAVKEIKSFALGYCASLKAIRFVGNLEQWNRIAKHPNWDAYAPTFQIQFI